MIGKPLSAQEWNDEFHTDVGQKIVEALMPFHERMPDLGKAPADAEDKLNQALLGIRPDSLLGIGDAKNVVIVSISDLRASAPLIEGIDPASLANGLVTGLSEEIRRKKKTELGDMLDAWYDATVGKSVGNTLVHEVKGTLDRSLFAEVFKTMRLAGFMDSKYLTYVRNFNLTRCLTYQVALLIAGKKASAAGIGQFCSLFASGVTPLILLQDDTFIAVSA